MSGNDLLESREGPADRDAPGSPLGLARRDFSGRIVAVRVDAPAQGISADELERRLIELGFVEGASVEVLHEGPFGRDPIAVRLNDTTIALRRREAMAIFVTDFAFVT